MEITLERILSLLPQGKNGKPVHGSRTSLARDLGLPPNIFAEWVGGRNKSYNNYLYQIAAKYDVSVEWLKGETDEKRPVRKDEPNKEKLLAAVETMNRDELIAMLELVTARLKEK